jgi:hypothetical protein
VKRVRQSDRIGLLFALVALAVSPLSGQTPPPAATPAPRADHAAHEASEPAGPAACSSHHAAVDARGDHVMGFDHAKTTHHFHLFPTGGSIDVSANAADDTKNRDAIRMHLSHIARMFAAGDFEAPMLIHDRVPPGVPVMREKKAEIRWEFEPTERGGAIRIATKNRKALAAVHEFLRFQIEDHQTGDPLEVSPEPPTAKP